MSRNWAAVETLQFEDVVVERFPLGKHKANAYIVYNASDRRAVLIDPGADGEILMGRVAELRLAIDAILLTHAHWDHVGAANEIATHAGAPVYLHPEDRLLIKAAPIYAFRIDGVRFSAPSRLVDLVDGATIPLGESRAFSVRHIPGHTEGGVAYRLGRAVFTGDTLMPAGAGRTDLPGGHHGKLQRSLAWLHRELVLDDVICPGHRALWPSSEASAWLSNRLETPE